MRVGRRLVLTLFMLAAMALPATIARAATTVSPAQRAALTARAHQLFDKREQARRGEGIALPGLHDELVACADSLDRAGLDSLAAACLHRAGALSVRLSEIPRGTEEFRRGITLAEHAKARDLANEIRGILIETIATTDPERAITLAHEFLPQLERAHDYDRISDVQGALHTAYLNLGRVDEALDAAAAAVSAAAHLDQPNTLPLALTQYSTSLHAAGREAEALAMADSAIRCGMRLGAGLAMARAWVCRSNALRELGHPVEALAAIDSALAVDKRRGDQRHAQRTRLIKGHLLFTLQRYPEMLAVSDTLMRSLRVPADRLFEPRVEALRTLALAELRRYTEAETALAREVPRFETLRAAQDDPENAAGLFIRGGELYATWSRCLLETGHPAQAWRVTERGRAWVFRSQLGDEGESRAQAELRDVQRALNASSATLVQYSDPQRNPLCAFVVTGDSLRPRWLGRPGIEKDATLAIELLSANAPAEQSRGPLERIASALITPLLPLLPGGARRLWIVPPSELSGFPFEALPLPDPRQPGETLGDRFVITYLPSASAMLTLAQRTPAASGVTIFADPDLKHLEVGTGADAARVKELARTPLSGARAEAKRIAPPGATIVTGRAASRARLMAPATQQSSVLHFATHALLDPARPEASGILLAGPDGLVTAAAVESLSLRSDLVTLSGCRTGGGQTLLGEGVFGLSRSFLLAGARSVVTSLWDVGDQASANFMGVFYDGLRSGLARDESLQRARGQMRAAHASPRDTYGFVLSGTGAGPVPALAGAGTAKR